MKIKLTTKVVINRQIHPKDTVLDLNLQQADALIQSGYAVERGGRSQDNKKSEEENKPKGGKKAEAENKPEGGKTEPAEGQSPAA